MNQLVVGLINIQYDEMVYRQVEGLMINLLDEIVNNLVRDGLMNELIG